MCKPDHKSITLPSQSAQTFSGRHRAASLVGYGLLLGLIAITAIVALQGVGTQVTDLFDAVGAQMETANTGDSVPNGEEINNENEDEPEEDGLAPCVNNPPQAGEEGCDPGDETLFAGLLDVTLTSNPVPIYAMPFDLPSSYPWKDSNTDSGTQGCSSPGFSHSRCFDGKANTADLLSASGIHAAAEACNNVTFGGHGPGEWYLPSLQELSLLYQNLRLADVDEDEDGISDMFGFAIVGTSPSLYRSSSESSDTGAFNRGFDTGVFGSNSKTNSRPIRCVRR